MLLSLAMLLALTLPSLSGCGGEEQEASQSEAASKAAIAFLDALGNQDVGNLRSMFTRGYLEENDVPDPIGVDHLTAALGYVLSYRFSPDQDLVLEGDRSVVHMELEVTGRGTREETLVLSREDGEWKVSSFTALDWSKKPAGKPEARTEVEQALRDFLIACVDGRTDYIFEHLSDDYRQKHRLEKPWTSTEFSGVFGTARSYDFDPGEIKVENDAAEVDVTIEFGTRGNLESETSRVRLVKKGKTWLVDVFPFFIY
ncbi:MAG: hypothetical protein HPY75_11220 [Actinobacteria bacterium]|nr:hypothetical protein [Actinomycetota bacterium]